jgi:ElaB/YqjD/DUF883 family membrane-anchored ribosome-binding protein
MATYHRPEYEGPSPGMETAAGKVEEKVQEGRERVQGRLSRMAESGKERIAERLDRLGQGLEDRARPWEEQGGGKGRIGSAVHRAGDMLEDSAEYLRTHEIGQIRDDVREQIVAHPFLSCGIALGTGFVLGRLFSPGEEERYERPERRRRRGMPSRAGRLLMAGAGAMLARRLRR